MEHDDDHRRRDFKPVAGALVALFAVLVVGATALALNFFGTSTAGPGASPTSAALASPSSSLPAPTGETASTPSGTSASPLPVPTGGAGPAGSEAPGSGPTGTPVVSVTSAPGVPTGFDVSNAIAINQLPFGHSLNVRGFNGPHHGYDQCEDVAERVWFSYSPRQAGTIGVTTDGSDFYTAVWVFTQDRSGALALVGCDNAEVPAFRFDAAPSANYLILVSRATGRGMDGDRLVLNVDQAPPPLEVALTVDGDGELVSRELALIPGAARCSRRVDALEITVSLDQAGGDWDGQGQVTIRCTRQITQWVAEIRLLPWSGGFDPGGATVLASTRSCEVFAGGEHCTSFSAGELLNGPENVWLEDERVSTPPSEEPEVEPTAAPPTP